MSALDSIIQEASRRFGLGDKAIPLVQELIGLMTGSPGGISAFIEKFKSAGFGSEAAAWLGNSDSAAMTSSQIEKVLGSNIVGSIAQKVGLSGPIVSAAMGYLVPKIVGELTPGGTIAAVTPSSVTEFKRSISPTYVTPPFKTTEAAATARQEAAGSSSGRWAVPLAASLALLGLGWYMLGNRSAEEQKQAADTQGIFAPSTREAAVSPGVSPNPPATMASRLAIRTENGVVNVSGMVRDAATRDSILDGLRSVYGNAVNGNIVVNPNVSPAPWLASLREGLQQLKAPAIADADRERILGSLRSTLESPNLALGAPDMSDIASKSTASALKALASLGANFQSSDLAEILNKSIINFPNGNAELPTISQALLQQAAARLKQLPAGTVVEIRGHTDGIGDAISNLRLSQSRADSVKAALIQAGVNPATVITRGYGSSSPVATNETAEGRAQNRRIEYRITTQ